MANVDLLPHTALTFDGTVLMRDDGLFLAIKKGIGEIPLVRGSDQGVPHRAGRIRRARVADKLLIELEGLVRGIPDETDDDPSEAVAYLALVDEVTSLFDPTGSTERTLSYQAADGTTRSIGCSVVPPLLWEELIPGRLARLNVALEAVEDPTWSIV